MAPRAAVVILHGGKSGSRARVPPWSVALLRMRPFGRALAAAGGRHGLVVATLRNRYRGWNGAAADPISDVDWALTRLRASYGTLPVCLLGHSLGARAAVRSARHDDVTSVAALAPWIPPGEPVAQLRGRTLLVAHGDRDRTTDPKMSRSYAEAARRAGATACRFVVAGDGHPMLRRAGDWTDLVRRFVLGALDLEPVDPQIANAMQSPDGLDIPLTRSR